MKIIKILLITVVVCTVAAGAGLVGAVKWAEGHDMKGLVAWAAKKQGLTVAVDGPVRVKLWPKGEVTVGHLAVLNPADQSKVAELDQGRVAWQWGSGLLPWKGLQVTDVYAQNPTLTLTKNRDGIGNWQGLAGTTAAADKQAAATAAPQPPALPLGMLAAAKLQVENLNLTYADAQTGRKIVAKSVNLDVTTDGSVAMTKLGGTVNDSPVKGALQVDVANLENVPVTATVEGAGLKVAVDGRVLRQNTFAGQINAQTANLRQTLGVLLGKAPEQAPASEFRLMGDMDIGTEQLALRNFTTRLGELLQATGDATVKMGDKPSATGKVRVQGNNLRQLAELLGGAAQPSLPTSPFTLTTDLSGKDAIVLNNLRFALGNLLNASGQVQVVPPAAGGTLKLDADLSLNVPNLQSLTNSMGQTGNFPGQPLTAQLKLKGVDGAYTVQNLTATVADVATLQGNVQIIPGSKLKVEGAFKLDGANLKTAAAAFGIGSANLPTSAFKAGATVSGQGVLTVSDLVIDLPQLLEATGKFDVTPGMPLNINGTLNITRLDATALGYCAAAAAPAATAAAGGGAPAAAGQSPWTDDKINLSSLQKVAFDINLKADGIACARFPVKTITAKLVNTPSQLDVQNLTVGLPEGGSAKLVLRLQHAGEPNLMVQLDTSGLPLEDAVPVLKTKGVQLPLDIAAKLNSQGATTRALAGNLGGTVSVNSNRGTLPYTDLLGTVTGLSRALQGTSATTAASNGDGKVDSLSAAYTIRHGVATTDRLNVATGNGSMTLTGSGTIDIGQWLIDYKLTPTVNAGGGLAIPVVVTGALSAPKIGADPEFINKLTTRLATEGVKSLLGVDKDDAKGVGGAIGGILSGKGVNKEDVGNLLNNFLGGKKKTEGQ
jgi:hypothetical protein